MGVAGDLVDTLSSPGPFTVFAPTNEAFGALPEGTLDSLLKPENKDQLVDILTYHVLPAQVLSTDLKYFQSVTTVEGKNVHVFRTRKGVYVGPNSKELKKVVGADNLASNGVAHIIDGVLLPPSAVMPSPTSLNWLNQWMTSPRWSLLLWQETLWRPSAHQGLSLSSPQPMRRLGLSQQAPWTVCWSRRTRISLLTSSHTTCSQLKSCQQT